MLRKFLSIALALFLFIPAAFSESIAVNFTDTAALIGLDGTERIAPGTYEYIFSLSEDADTATEEFFSAGNQVGEDFFYALLDSEGNCLTDQIYDMFFFGKNYVLFIQNGLYGIMSLTGEVLIEAKYTQLVPNGQDGCLAIKTDCFDEQPDGLYYIDVSLNETATGVKTLGPLGWFTEDKLALLSAENGLYGYVDATGQWAIRPQFNYAASFSGNRAVASLSTGYGLIDETGNWVLTPKYETLTCEDTSLALVMQGSDTVIAFDPQSCQELFRLTGENLYTMAYSGMVQVYDDTSARLYDLSGNLVYEDSPLASFSNGENGQSIIVNGDWGADCAYLLNSDGSIAAGPYKSLFSIEQYEGMGYYGFVVFDATSVYDESLGQDVYEWDDSTIRYGIIDETGKTVLEAAYEDMYYIAENRLFVRAGEIEGVIDFAGNYIYQINTTNE